jgi:hypothetical protein
MRKSNTEIAREAVRRARVLNPKAGRCRLFLNAKAMIIRENYGSPTWLIISMLWPLILELLRRRGK